MGDESAIEFVHSQQSETTRDVRADVSGIDQLLRKYDGLISRIAASYEFHPSRAQDLTQEILIAVWRAWPSLRMLRTHICRAHRALSGHHSRGEGDAVRLD